MKSVLQPYKIASALIVLLVVFSEHPATAASLVKKDEYRNYKNNTAPFEDAVVNKQISIGTCQCPKRSFDQQYKAAYTVTKATVINERTDCKLCHGGMRNELRIHIYFMRIRYQMKGPNLGEYFTIQGLAYVNLCGIRLRIGDTYLLMLPNPRLTSLGSFWINPTTWPQVSQCETYRFSDLTAEQFRYSQQRRWEWEKAQRWHNQ